MNDKPQLLHLTEAQEGMLNRLIVRFTSQYGVKFTSLIEGKVAHRDWLLTWQLGLRGLMSSQIREALDLLPTSRFALYPPTPAEFRSLIEKPVDYEKSFLLAQAQAQRVPELQKWPDKQTYWCAELFGQFTLKNAVWETSQTEWTRCMDEILSEEVLLDIPGMDAKAKVPKKTKLSDKATSAIQEAKDIIAGRCKLAETPTLNPIDSKSLASGEKE